MLCYCQAITLNITTKVFFKKKKKKLPTTALNIPQGSYDSSILQNKTYVFMIHCVKPSQVCFCPTCLAIFGKIIKFNNVRTLMAGFPECFRSYICSPFCFLLFTP